MRTLTEAERVAAYLDLQVAEAKRVCDDDGPLVAFGWLVNAVRAATSDLRRDS